MKIFLSLLSVFILNACSVPSPTTQTPESEVVAEESFYYWPSQGQKKIIYEILTTESEAINTQSPNIVNLDEEHPLVLSINGRYQQVRNEIQSDATLNYQQVLRDEDIPPMTWDYSVNWLGGRYHPKLWSLAFQVYSYTGGAHGNHWTDTFNYHPGTNRILELTDFFTDETYAAPLSDAVLAAVIEAKKERWEAAENEETYNSAEDSFLEDITFDAEALSRWVVSEQDGVAGFMFFFPPYDIGPYVEGGYEVFIPKTMFEEWLKDEFKEVFE